MAYNGWSNYETWCVKLWMDNEEGSYRYWQGASRRERDASALARELKEDTENMMPELSGMFADLLSAALSEVDWYEIAESLIEDNAEDDDDAESEDADAS